MLNDLKKCLEKTFDFRLNKNQQRDIERLFFEIIRREHITQDDLISYLKNNGIEKHGGRNRFFAIKNVLIKRRFPLTSKKEKIDTKKVFLNQINPPIKGAIKADNEFKPTRIFFEKEVRASYLVENFRKAFPATPIDEINQYSDYIKENKFRIEDLKKPLVFIVKEKWDFLKPCPCTKGHLGCGYWILNLGFGCPFDCSYCFLQSYANFPGLLLPANIEDFFTEFDALYKKLKKPIRIGTGEFCDSLALDNITGYSLKLIPYLKDKNVFFELKTKSNKIDNLLKMTPGKNIIISWSLNPASIIEAEELFTATLDERLSSARMVQEKGYSLAFHFDPVIYNTDWKKMYGEVLNKMYSMLKPPFAWISLGTLRSHRSLKSINEGRFPKSNIFYGELFLGDDKKLRYPEFLRKEIYSYMIESIRKYDTKTPLYLCMENQNLWQLLDKKSTDEIEDSLLKLSR